MISREEVDTLAELARLKLTDEEASGLQKDISNILDYVGQVSMQSGQGSTLTQDSPRSNLRNVMRADLPRADGDPLAGKREALLAALPKREGDYAVVRKIIQKDE